MKKYGDKLRKLLEVICKEAVRRGHECRGPYDMTDEEEKWSILIVPQGASEEDGVDVSVTIEESGLAGDAPGGVNFTLGAASYRGHVLGDVVTRKVGRWVEPSDVWAMSELWDHFREAVNPKKVLDWAEKYWASPPPEETEETWASASEDDLKTIDSHRRSLGMGPIDPSAGWSVEELRGMAESIRTTGRMNNPRSEQLKRKLMR